MNSRHLLIGSSVLLVVVNLPIAYANYRAGDVTIAFNHALFAFIGIGFLATEFLTEDPSPPTEEIKELESRMDPEVRPALRFVANNEMLFSAVDDHSRDDLIELAADYYDVNEERIRRAREELQADMEVLARTGELPSKS